MSERPRILLADDDEDILELVAFGLERDGYEILLARDGEEALAQARATRPDLCVLDVTMPKLTGVEVTRALREDASTQAMPVILLTARARESDVSEGFDAGADDYVRKPFSPRELRARVQAVLTRR